MFLRESCRKKDGKEHHYWNVVENRRLTGGRVVQRQVLYLGEINDQQQAAWRRTIEIFDPESQTRQSMALFPDDRALDIDDESVVRIRLADLQLHRARQWGGCWLFTELYHQLGLDEFWWQRLPSSRKGTPWDKILQTLVGYRFLSPGSEWKLHRQWFEQSAMGDLLGEDFGLVEIHKLYRCHDGLLKHKDALFSHLQTRWRDLFGANYEVLLYDLTSTYFEIDPPEGEDKRKFGYSRDKRFDCVQIVIALIITPEGFPIAYEVMPGNTADKTTLPAFLETIQKRYGKADRVWIMDRGVPTKEILQHMRDSVPPIYYLVGTPKGRLTKLESQLADLPWQAVREGIEVKLLPQEKEVYVLAQSRARISKERAMRRRQLKKLWKRLRQLQGQKLTRDQLLLQLGAAKQQSPSAWRLVDVQVPKTSSAKALATLTFALRKKRFRDVRRREGRYLLRSNLTDKDPAILWNYYMQLTQIEEAFRNLKGDLALRPIFHQKIDRVETHVFISFIAYCLHVTLRQRLRVSAPGLTPRSVLEKFSTIQMIDVHLPTTDDRTIILPRYTQPERDVQILLDILKLSLPEQPPPKIRSTSTKPHVTL